MFLGFSFLALSVSWHLSVSQHWGPWGSWGGPEAKCEYGVWHQDLTGFQDLEWGGGAETRQVWDRSEGFTGQVWGVPVWGVPPRADGKLMVGLDGGGQGDWMGCSAMQRRLDGTSYKNEES
ncbi:hypothetical protein H2248_005875 [Termitomyces sp. 'cryptogamus']|nr:hypothetical protein H2248_005875 [Termitomyces sp. 'cryptogamus']